jgi:hypothetical protein
MARSYLHFNHNHGRHLERWYFSQTRQYYRICCLPGIKHLHDSISIFHLLQWKGDLHYSSALGVPHLVQVPTQKFKIVLFNICFYEGLLFTFFFSVLSYISSSPMVKELLSMASLGDSRSLRSSMLSILTSGPIVITSLVSAFLVSLPIFLNACYSFHLCSICQLRSDCTTSFSNSPILIHSDT